MIALYILIAVLGFGFLVLIHELGHYLTARAFGVTVKEFSIGMGPTILSYTSKKTGIVYKISALPFGGYVSMAGEDEESDDPNAINKKPAWQRLIVMAAGGVINLFCGVILTGIVLASVPNALYRPQIHSYPVRENATASSADYGLQPGDFILKIDGRRIHTGAEMDYEIMRKGTKPIKLTVKRGEEVFDLTVTFPTFEEQGQTMGGRDFVAVREEHTVGTVLKHTVYRSTMMVRMVWESLYDLITGRYGADAVSGPVGVAAIMTDAAKSGINDFLYLLSVISLNLGVMNLLPFPALDGGRIVFVLWEMITRRKVPEKIENAIHGGGLMLLLGLMLLVSVKDVFGLIF